MDAVIEAQKMLRLLETFWLQQEDDNNQFISSLQRMKDRVSMIRACQMVQKGIQDYFQRI